MLLKNKGSILIMALMVFTIISIICISCASLILSNNRINKLDYDNEVLKQGNLGIIEIVRSNVLQEVKSAIETTNNEDAFYNYFTKNNSYDFINKSQNISSSNIKNGEATITYDSSLSNKEFIRYKIVTKNKIDSYDKYIRVSVKIKNPWYGKSSNFDDVETNSSKDDLLEINKDESSKDTMNGEIDNTKDEKTDKVESILSGIEINESDLVIFYNYEEI